MPKVPQAHLDARRQQIIDAARARFATHGFARTSLADIVAESGLSNGSIYRYFTSKDQIVTAVCEESSAPLPSALTLESATGFLEHVRAAAREKGHARLVAQIYAEAAVSPSLAEIVDRQLAAMRTAVADLIAADHPDRDSESAAEAFVAVSVGYILQLAVRGDLDSAPFAKALTGILREET
jgi:AcrR family transcriptional regulator